MTQLFDSTEETALERMLQHYWPGITSRQVAALLSARVDRTTISNWRYGRRRVPAWALDDLSQHAKAFELTGRELAANAQKEIGPGKKAGARNLAEYLARRR